MINISIKNFYKEIDTPKKIDQFLSLPFSLYEKIDGTKLTLIRNNEKFNKDDYSKNWIIAYKNCIIYPEEFSGLVDKDILIKIYSIGTSQYKLIHEHIKSIHINCESIPLNTEFFIEFAQKKLTLTRDYKNIGFFLIGIGFNCKYIVNNNFVYTIDKEPDLMYFDRLSTDFNKYQTLLNLFVPKCLLVQQIISPSTVESIFNKFLLTPSALDGQMEGLIIHSQNGKVYKVLQTDQHDKTVRQEKKDKYKMDVFKEDTYWKHVYYTSNVILSRLTKDYSFQSKLNIISKIIYGTTFKFQHEKKVLLNIQDDVFLTSKLQLLNELPENSTIGIFPLSGKPVHDGHWKVIEKMSNENDYGILLVSVKDRIKKGEFPICGEAMFKIWQTYLINKLPKNIIFKIVDSPFNSVFKEINLFGNLKKNYYINVYSDTEDIQKYDKIESDKIKLCGIRRNETVNISGTQMRSFLKVGNENNFKMYLPSCLSALEKNEVLNLIKNE